MQSKHRLGLAALTISHGRAWRVLVLVIIIKRKTDSFSSDVVAYVICDLVCPRPSSRPTYTIIRTHASAGSRALAIKQWQWQAVVVVVPLLLLLLLFTLYTRRTETQHSTAQDANAFVNADAWSQSRSGSKKDVKMRKPWECSSQLVPTLRSSFFYTSWTGSAWPACL